MSTPLDKAPAPLPELAGKYLTFLLGGQFYGIPVLKIREILRMMEVTAVPQLPPYIRGVVNLRGKIIPVLDLRRRFQLASDEITESTCIIVVQVTLRDGVSVWMGLVADGVDEVITVGAGDVEPAPQFGAALRTDYLLGMAKVKGKVKTLLDIDKVAGADELERIAAHAS